MRFFFLILCILLINSCRQIPGGTVAEKTAEWARGFSISRHKGFSVLEVYDPWQKAQGYSFRYVIKSKGVSLPDSLSGLTTIIRPVKKAVVLSTTHVGFISALEEQESIVAVSGKQYIYDGRLRKRIKNEEVSDIGYAPNIDYERIVALDPDVVFLYGLESSIAGVAERLTKAGIPSVIIGEYLENHPLAKMEWVRVVAEMYEKPEVADSIFRQRTTEYLQWKNKLTKLDENPEVLVGMPWKDTWYMAGGKSYTARLIEDAGGHYLWHEDSSDEYIPLNLESAFMGALNADVWINTGSAGSLGHITGSDERFALLDVVSRGNVYNNDNRINPWGGNDFWESGVMHPEIILKDLIKIFHPGQIESHDFVYYRKLE